MHIDQLKDAGLVDRLTGTPALDRLHAALVPSPGANEVIAAIAALPLRGLDWASYTDIMSVLVAHLLDASQECDKWRTTFEGHGYLDAAHKAEELQEWFDAKATAEQDGTADEARTAYYVTRLPRFKNVSCSNCGGEFGPGDSGFSHCDNHKHLRRIA
jgi:hypothetical protein